MLFSNRSARKAIEAYSAVRGTRNKANRGNREVTSSAYVAFRALFLGESSAELSKLGKIRFFVCILLKRLDECEHTKSGCRRIFDLPIHHQQHCMEAQTSALCHPEATTCLWQLKGGMTSLLHRQRRLGAPFKPCVGLSGIPVLGRAFLGH
jgi:hypothetical protein